MDSGSTDETLNYVPDGSIVHRYVGSEFNFADALNQGLAFVTSDFVLIISSHTALTNPGAIDYALNLLQDENLGAAYFCNEGGGALTYERIDRSNFDGFNGLWNTCAVVRTALLRQRGFNPEVFSAEDQEWAKWLLIEQGKATARISGGGVVNRNPRHHSPKKRLNEYVSVAYFVNRKLLAWRNIARIAYRAIRPVRVRTFEERLASFVLVWRLLACRLRKPKYRSRYF